MKSSNDIAVLNNGMLNNFIKTKQRIVIKVLKTFTNKIQDMISSRNRMMSVTMKTQIWVNSNAQILFCSSVEVIMVEFNT